MKCSYCNKKIEEDLEDNEDADGNKYCSDCVSKFECVAEMEELNDS